MNQGFYSVSGFLEIYAIGRTTFYRMVKAGEIRITKIGGATRVAKAEAERWADSLPTVSGGEPNA